MSIVCSLDISSKNIFEAGVLLSAGANGAPHFGHTAAPLGYQRCAIRTWIEFAVDDFNTALIDLFIHFYFAFFVSAPQNMLLPDT